ncbi:hypothetical protein JAAARDRAFT_28555 [Jaapia argillacea MUCL 33604]|uniref:ACB domain-containing protein n=1 Tax=Jaapia argillacea MUCL 33604 TaxID=933084 RepID=A0A067QCW2_9AGAM|nr:hypothetical protein JAAARDRAFT_28555 [Jaapia argillacea MUCL 33604]
MDSRELIDAQFDRAVEIIQGLPKNGPIQTGYEEKLTMYSLYKQATVGNVKSPRPGIWDMLGRAKWDAWAKHKDLDSYEAKWLYVDALLKVLRRYSDKTVARDLVQELESYGGDPSNLVRSRSMSRTPRSSTSASDTSDDAPSSSRYPRPRSSNNAQHSQASLQARLAQQQQIHDDTTSEEDTEDEDQVPPVPSIYEHGPPQSHRPQSSVSSNRYRTPMAGSLAALSPPPGLVAPIAIPGTQPLPGFETPSAFEGPSATPSLPSTYRQPSTFPSHFSQSPPNSTYPPPQSYRPPTSQYRPYNVPPRSASRISLERAIESVQAHLAALTERLESLEAAAAHPGQSTHSMTTRTHSRHGSPSGHLEGLLHSGWNIDDMGMWSIVLRPLSQVTTSMRQLTDFLIYTENRSPGYIVIRRLFLDISFILAVLALVRAIWKRTGVRRGEVNKALLGLWYAVVGKKKERRLIDRGV